MKGVSTGEELLLSFEVGSSSSASKPDDDVSTFAAEVEYAGAEADRITLLNPATCFCAGAASGSGRTLGACGVAPSSLEGVADDCAVGVVAVPSIVVVVSNYIEIKRVGSQCTVSTPVNAFLECKPPRRYEDVGGPTRENTGACFPPSIILICDREDALFE